MSRMLTIPYVVGQWVRAERFYGRRALLQEVLAGPRDCLWLLGTRRIGKTSLLKQLEFLTAAGDGGYMPLFWDLQGADEPGELHLSFHDALLDAQERLEGLGVDLTAMDPQDLFASLGRLRRRLRSSGRQLLLLCDEVEELIKLDSQDSSLLRKLRRSLQSGSEIRSVLASTIRLCVLADQRQDTSPFLHGFAPPVYIATLTDEEARALLRQEHLPRDSRPDLATAEIEEIRTSCDNHPYLLQLMGKRYLEVGDVAEASERVAMDEMVSYFLAVDFEMLSTEEQEILRTLSESPPDSSASLESRLERQVAQLAGSLLRLEGLGFLRRNPDGELVLVNRFFRRWLARGSRPAPRTERLDRHETPFSERLTEILSHVDAAPEARKASPQELLDAVYDELRQLARRYMSRERANHTLQPTALVHEAYLRLVDQSRVDWQGRTHFYAVGARMMRRILIDHARTRKRGKRGGDWLRVSWAEEIMPSKKGELTDEELLDLDLAIVELGRINERQARIVELRYFAGLTVAEVARFLGVSKRTAEGDWATARDWLRQRLSRDPDTDR